MRDTRPTDHKKLNLAELNIDIFRGKSNGKILWQPRIICWYEDRNFNGLGLPEPYKGMDLVGLYNALGCSNRIYDYTACFERVDDPRVKRYTNKISGLEYESIIEAPVGKLSCILQGNTSNSGVYPRKWWITSEEDMKKAIWIEEHTDWRWNDETYRQIYARWGNNGAPNFCFPRPSTQNLIVETMGTEEAIYAIYDYPETVEKYFKVLDESHERLINVINSQNKIEIINFGDNIHGGILPPGLFKKYVLPIYQKRNELLHKSGKFTHAHWDGDVKPLLSYLKETGLDGIEALTPKPQGDVTLEEMKEAVGGNMILLDGIAALLFNELYSEEQLIDQTKRIIELFAPKLILGISDEMASTGNIERIRLVGKIVDDYNASLD